MNTLTYLFQTAVKNFWSEKWMNLLTVLTIAVGILIISAFALITLNIDITLKNWSSGFGLVVYLKDNITAEEEGLIKNHFKKDPDITQANYITKDQALKGLRQTLGSATNLLEGFESNPLPSSFELKIKRESLTPAGIKEKAERLKQLRGVEDVQYGEKWLASMDSLSKGMKILTVSLGSIILIALAFVNYSTIKILFYRRADEIDTMKLLGASRSFIRLPFLIEGLFIGLSSGIIALLALFGIYAVTTARTAELIPSIKSIAVFFPPAAYPVLPLGGALMSLIGSLFAIGRIKY